MPRSTARTMAQLRFQRRHYQFMAETIAEYYRIAPASVTLAAWFASALRGTNPGFNRDRFIDACGPMPEPRAPCLLCQSETKA